MQLGCKWSPNLHHADTPSRAHGEGGKRGEEPCVSSGESKGEGSLCDKETVMGYPRVS